MSEINILYLVVSCIRRYSSLHTKNAMEIWYTKNQILNISHCLLGIDKILQKSMKHMAMLCIFTYLLHFDIPKWKRFNPKRPQK